MDVCATARWQAMSQSTETGTFDEGRPLPYRAISSSVGRDESQSGIGNPRITIDMGKSVNAIALCAAFCGICMAATVLMYFRASDREYATQQQEVSTEAQFRKTQNHVDEMTNELKRLRDRLEDKSRAPR